MSNDPQDLTTQAEALMQEQRFGEAIAAFDAHLARRPSDAKALLQLGICHLLQRSEQVFLDIYHRAGRLLSALDAIPAEVARLWRLYRSLVAKVTATALVTSTVGLTACDKTEATPDPAVAPASSPATTAASTEPTAEPTVEPAESAATAPSATAAPTAPATATAAATAAPPSPPPPATTTTPAHRYSGGVVPKPTPAHRYSAGVRR